MAAAKAFTPHAVLKGAQRDASDPRAHVWLSASAGTGKTYVLSARVLRLLLRGVKPDSILCLTFTKAGAAEMAERVHERLAHWVRLEPTLLAAELRALDEDFGPEQVDLARTLFAEVLEARGGGLRIMTIHAFCQTLLAGFPLEAGIAPGFRPLEGREEAALARTVLNALVTQGEHEGDDRLIADLRVLSRRMGEDAAVAFLKRAARAGETLQALSSGLEARVRRALGVPSDYDDAWLQAQCADGAFDRASLLELARMLDAWGTARAVERLDILSGWLHETPAQRARSLPQLARIWCKADGSLFAGSAYVPADPRYAGVVERLHAWCGDLIAQAGRAELAAQISSALHAGWRYAMAYADAKRVRGFVDFDDQIRLARDLLRTPGMGDWIRYKLDQATDHILVDEAQDTNSDQWGIVWALAEEFWAGDGAKSGTLRTMFTVGDFKQAIFGFQGTDPDHFEAAGVRFREAAAQGGQAMLGLSLNESFRSAPAVLEVVDAVLEALGPEALGLPGPGARHASVRGGQGSVILLPAAVAKEEDGGEGRDDEEGWVSPATRELAKSLAGQVRAWIDTGLWIAGKNEGKGGPISAGDIMILVRKRTDLAALLVARMIEAGVDVAGVDRLRLHAPLAVQDLLSAARFAVQPLDDLALGNLLVSPLFGWSQDDLLAVAHGRRGHLWEALPAGPARDALLDILRAADNITPYAFLENLLSGRLGGRAKIIARMGEDARDPVNELLNAALQFEVEGEASLQQFLHWFDRGEVDVVRDPGASGDAVRVMTVHGAKGLEAPVVILADACVDPERGGDNDFKWTVDDVIDRAPLFPPRKAERLLAESIDRSAADGKARAVREHWRLLYVAMTRARERLVIAGSLGPGAKGVVPEQSWHAAVGRAMRGMGADVAADARWGEVLRHGDAPTMRAMAAKQDVATSTAFRPGWLDRPAPQEARPPRPLSPSSIGQDDTPLPPPGAAMMAAAERGRLLHGLFERLPDLPVEGRRAAGLAWLGDAGEAEALVETALRVIEAPAHARIFARDGLAEAPIAGIVDGIVIAGTVDRLVIAPDSIEVVDFKTGRRVPQTLDAIPAQHLRQMAAYAAVLRGIFPDRAVHASLLYSEGPVLHRLPEAMLAAHKPGLATAQEELPVAG